MSAVRVGDCPAWAAYVSHADSRGDNLVARCLAASVVLPVAVPLGWMGRHALKQIVQAVAVSLMTPEDRIAASIFHDHGVDDAPHVRDVVDAVMPPEHSDRIRGGDTMRLALAAAAWAWSHGLVFDDRVDALARAIAMPRAAMLVETDGTAEEIAGRFDVSLEVAAARLHDLEVREDDSEAPLPKAERGVSADAATRRRFVALYGGPLDSVEACALEFDRELRAWHEAWHEAISHGYAADRRRYDAAELRTRFYPRGWVRILRAIERDRRRTSTHVEQPAQI